MGSRNNMKQPYRVSSSRAGSIFFEPSNHTFPQCVAQVATDPHLKFNHHLAPISDQRSNTNSVFGRPSDIMSPACPEKLDNQENHGGDDRLNHSWNAGTGPESGRNVSSFPQKPQLYMWTVWTIHFGARLKFDGRYAIPWKIWGHGNYAKIRKANLLELPLCLESNLPAQGWDEKETKQHLATENPIF